MTEDKKKELAYVPTKEELFADKWSYPEIENKVAQLLSNDPNPLWLVEHKDYKGFMYVPIDKCEIMLNRIFKKVNIEVLREGVNVGLGVWVTVRVNYYDPHFEDMRFQDGTAGWVCEKKKDFNFAFQAAKSNAIKDACDHLGKVFGRDLNRNSFPIEVYPLGGLEELILIYKEAKELLSPEEQINFDRVIEKQEKTSYKKGIDKLKKLIENDKNKAN